MMFITSLYRYKQKCQHCPSTKHAEQDAVVHQDDDGHSPKNTAREPTSIHSGQLLMVLIPTDDVIMLTEKVGCILVTSHLQQFLEDFHLQIKRLS